MSYSTSPPQEAGAVGGCHLPTLLPRLRDTRSGAECSGHMGPLTSSGWKSLSHLGFDSQRCCLVLLASSAPAGTVQQDWDLFSVGCSFRVPEHRCPQIAPVPWLDLLSLCSFVMINSVALEGDGCDICSRAEAELLEISHWLNCSREVGHPPTPAPLQGHGHPCLPLPPTIQCPVSEEPGL